MINTQQRKELILLQVEGIKHRFQALLIYLWAQCLEASPSVEST